MPDAFVVVTVVMLVGEDVEALERLSWRRGVLALLRRCLREEMWELVRRAEDVGMGFRGMGPEVALEVEGGGRRVVKLEWCS
jgi:hypothetical protein